MEELILIFFPFPTVHGAVKRAGYRIPATSHCERCANQCQSMLGDGLMECPFGINIFRSGDLLVYGFLSETSGSESSQRKIARRRNGKSQVKVKAVSDAIKTYEEAKASIVGSIEDAKRAVVDEYRQNREFQADLLELLKPELQKRLTFLHDYKQFIARVKQNINVMLETRYLTGTLEEKLRRASKPEVAMYWAAEMMEEKLDSVFLLSQPDKLFSLQTTKFRLHGVVIKYARIYQAAFDEKGVRLVVTGESIGDVRAYARSFGVVPHALIDNALKYSVRGSQVNITFAETGAEIKLTVSSFGPKIETGEAQKIFDLLYRGVHAIKHEQDGTGFGLYLAQTVAQQAGTKILVEQAAEETTQGFETKFCISLPRAR